VIAIVSQILPILLCAILIGVVLVALLLYYQNALC
jgi:hypothetical protein